MQVRRAQVSVEDEHGLAGLSEGGRQVGDARCLPLGRGCGGDQHHPRGSRAATIGVEGGELILRQKPRGRVHDCCTRRAVPVGIGSVRLISGEDGAVLPLLTRELGHLCDDRHPHRLIHLVTCPQPRVDLVQHEGQSEADEEAEQGGHDRAERPARGDAEATARDDRNGRRFLQDLDRRASGAVAGGLEVCDRLLCEGVNHVSSALWV